jgi:GNAT superfamily N-acetyltransferase
MIECDVNESFRISQLKSIYDLPHKNKIRHSYHIDLPIENTDWDIGLIIGPSGSGKSVLINKIFDNNVHHSFKWHDKKAIIDDFPKKLKIQEILYALNSVGFSSPPSWLKPFRILSNGEKFRAELARAICEYKEQDFFVIDEFSSVVDREVAKICSHAISKAIRKTKSRMIAISCHNDIVKWLEPNWIFDTSDYTYRQVLLRRPKIKIEIRKISRDYWTMFKNHHYLSGNLHKTAKCFGGFINNNLVAFCALLPSAGHKNYDRVHRIVVLPDFQGVGIGRAVLNTVASYRKNMGKRFGITSSHPAMIHGLKNCKEWKVKNFLKTGSVKHRGKKQTFRWLEKTGRKCSIASFEYIGK